MSKKIIVTGGVGFIGSHVVDLLLQKGYHVRILDNLSKKSTYENRDAELIRIDLTDMSSSQRYFKGFDQCIHMAALIGGIGYFHKFPAAILSQNNKIYSTVFETCTKYDFKKIVYISSSMIFESTKTFPSKESDADKIAIPKTSYGFSKLMGEFYCKAFYEQYGLPFIILRPFNAYGINEFPGDKVGMSHVIPDLIYRTLKDQYPIEILGSGTQSRSFTHVSDIARGIIMALENNRIKNEDINLGNNKETKILDLAKLIHSLIRPTRLFKFKLVKGFRGDVKKRIPDVKKAKKVLGWEAQISLEEALPEIIEWSRKNFLLVDPRGFEPLTSSM